MMDVGVILAVNLVAVLACSPLEFKLKSMNQCHPLLNCTDMKDMQITSVLGSGSTKLVYRAVWKSVHQVAWNELGRTDLLEDFRSGLDNLFTFKSSPYVVQLVGFCLERNVYFTEVHEAGDARAIGKILETGQSETRCLDMCIGFAEIINHFHSGPLGARVMCDSNTLEKTLEQFLITDSGSLVANDLDALPLVGRGIKCGPREIHGDFVAPEQLWPHQNVPFSDGMMPSYNEKTDVWKMAKVCEYFLSFCDERHNQFQKLVDDIHEKCRSIEPRSRPSADEVLKEYRRIKVSVQALLGLSREL